MSKFNVLVKIKEVTKIQILQDLNMTIRKLSFVRIYNVLIVLVFVSLSITIMTFFVDENLRFSILKTKHDSTINISKSYQNYSIKNNVATKERTQTTLKCKPKTKIGFLKIHKAASR